MALDMQQLHHLGFGWTEWSYVLTPRYPCINQSNRHFFGLATYKNY